MLRVWTERPAWMADAACRGMSVHLFYPERGQDSEQAKAVCASCPVAGECRQAAIDAHEAYGVWGGLSAKTRLRPSRSGQPGRPGPAPGTTLLPIAHGTNGGYGAHMRRGIPVCDDCLRAHACYQARYKQRKGEAA